jgi:hypothetical protein
VKKRFFIFLTPDGMTYSSCEGIYPDVDNLQVLGWAEGLTKEDAFEEFLRVNRWVLDTNFKEVICVEARTRIHEGKLFLLKK